MGDFSAHWGGKPSVLVSRLRSEAPFVKQMAAMPRQRSMWPGSGCSGASLQLPIDHFRPLAIEALRRGAQQRRQGRDPFAAQRLGGGAQRARDQKFEIFVEVLPHAPQLRLIERARGLQASGEQRQPAIAARKHLGDQLDQPAPALIVESEYPLDGAAERVRLLMRQRTPRRLLIQRAGVLEQIQPSSRAAVMGS